MIELQKDNVDLDSLGFEREELDKIFNEKDPLFVSPDGFDMQEIPELNEEFMPSQVRMIQLFFNSSSEPIFKEMINELQERYNTDNLTDTVYKAIEYEHNKGKKSLN